MKNSKFSKLKVASSLLVALSVVASPVVSHAQSSNVPTLNTVEHTPDNELSMNDAGNIALWFIANDVKTNPNSGWNEKTRITKVTPLYDTNDQVDAYAFELQNESSYNGYVLVSASGDTSLIKEFSYTDQPIFATNNLANSDKIYYTGPESYFGKKDGIVFDLNNSVANLSQVTISTKHNQKALKDNLKTIRKVKQAGRIDLNAYMGASGQTSGGQGSYGGIFDSTQYVNSEYGGGFTADGYGTLEPAITSEKYLTSQFDQAGANDCTLVGLTTILEYYQYGSHALSTSYSAQDMYNNIIRPVAVSNGYTPSSGTPWSAIPTIASGALSNLKDTNGYVTTIYTPVISNVQDEIAAKHPFLWNIDTGYYSNHSIVGVGWNCYTDNVNTYYFVKVYDAWSTDNRYVDWSDYVGGFTVGDFVLVHA